mgnify:CR=1 FL=1
MNYNQFYRKKDKYKRPYTQEEQKNLKSIIGTFVKSMVVGMVTLLVIVLLMRHFG